MENKQTKSNKTLENIASVITNKRSRSLVFLIVTFVLILLANGMLPLVSGQAHYTADTIEVTYAQYVELKKDDKLIDLTYGSKTLILLYKEIGRAHV